MNKSDLVAAIAEKAEMSKKDAEKALKAFEDVVTEELTNNGKVQLVGDDLLRHIRCCGKSSARRQKPSDRRSNAYSCIQST